MSLLNFFFVVFFQVFVVGSWSHVEAVHPCSRYEFDEVVVACEVFCQHDKVPSRLVFFAFANGFVSAACHVHFTAEDWLEGFLSVFFPFLVDVVAVVVQFFGTEHVSVVGECHAAHSVGDGFVDHAFDGRLSVEQGVL